jgi:hypothetical protein
MGIVYSAKLTPVPEAFLYTNENYYTGPLFHMFYYSTPYSVRRPKLTQCLPSVRLRTLLGRHNCGRM